jgi:O-methyltransferase
MISERARKRSAALLVGKRAPLLQALGENALMHEWLEARRPFPYYAQRSELFASIAATLAAQPMDYLEFGVHKGDSLLEWTRIDRHPQSRFVGFDSFVGLPEAWISLTATEPKGGYSVGGVVPVCDDPRVRFIKGWFSDTLRPFLADFKPRSRLIVHNDSDLYSSTLYMLSTIDPLLIPGSIVMFDEFSNPLHEWRACRDYLSAFGRSCRVVGAAGGYYGQVAIEMTA